MGAEGGPRVGAGANPRVLPAPRGALLRMSPVRLTDPRLDYMRDEREIEAAIRAVLESGRYMLGPEGEGVELAEDVGAFVVEDCAQAHGTTYGGQHVGTFGDAGAFSFYPTKTLGALGDGGAVVTESGSIAERVRLLRQYGWNSNRLSMIPGWNSRLDELQAAILRVKLRHLPDRVARRREIAAAYRAAMSGGQVVPTATLPDGAHSYPLFVCPTGERD